MTKIEDLMPGIILQRSFTFKTIMLVFGALLLLSSSLLRENHPTVWILPFLLGALIEWFIVATVYVEIGQIENEISHAQDEIEDTVNSVFQIEEEINDTQKEIEEAKGDIFSSFSQSQGGFNSLEKRVNELEDHTGVDSISSRRNLETRIDRLEERLDKLERGENRRY